MFERFVIVTRSAASQKSPRAAPGSSFEQKCAANLNICQVGSSPPSTLSIYCRESVKRRTAQCCKTDAFSIILLTPNLLIFVARLRANIL
jgi:hypothetical protein